MTRSIGCIGCFIDKLHHLPFAKLFRYALAGLTLNLLGYLIYLTVTFLGLSPIATVSIFYPLSVFLGYLVHRRHTFRHKTKAIKDATFFRYIVSYAAGYLINVTLIQFLHHELGYPHQWVQAAAIFIVAAFLFVALNLFVFKERAHDL